MTDGHGGPARSESLSQLATPYCPTTTLNDIAIAAASHNNLLPDHVQTRARMLFSEAGDSLVSLDQQIAQVQTMLDDLHLRRRDKVTEINLYRSAVAPLRRLPHELISQIFLLCCASTSVTTPYILEEQQWVLGRVCSKWRQISLSTPELWSRIHVVHSRHEYRLPREGDAGPVVHHRMYSAMVKEVLRRSGYVPLSLTVVGDTIDPVDPFELFVPHLGRIRELHADKSDKTVKNFLALPPGLVPCLRTVDLANSSQIYLGQGTVFQDAPSLHDIAYRAYTTATAWIFKLPLFQLTRLIIPSVPIQPSQVLSILNLSPHLVVCDFAIRSVTSETSSSILPSGDPTINFVHNLQSLHLTLYGVENDLTGLQRLDLPQLRHFMLQTGWERAWDVRWCPTILRSGLLETLLLRDAIMSSEDLESLLRATPHLVELDISSGRMITSSILLKMADGVLVPKLSTLRCLICVTTPDDLGALELHLDMLEQRKQRETTTHIQNVWFAFLGREDMEIMFPGLNRVKEMNEEGWNIIRLWC